MQKDTENLKLHPNVCFNCAKKYECNYYDFTTGFYQTCDFFDDFTKYYAKKIKIEYRIIDECLNKD